MARGVDGREIFVDRRDHDLFTTVLTELKNATDLTMLAYCLMPNHFHLAIKVERCSLSSIIQRMLTRYSRTFNLRHDRAGHLFQARYKSIPCLSPNYLTRLIHYIHYNPVRAGLVARPEDWEWSSARIYSEGVQSELIDPEAGFQLLGFEGFKRESALKNFNPWDASDHQDLPRLVRPRFSGKEIENAAARFISESGASIDTLRSKRRLPQIVRLKSAFIRRALQEGFSLTDLARWWQCTPAAVYYLSKR